MSNMEYWISQLSVEEYVDIVSHRDCDECPVRERCVDSGLAAISCTELLRTTADEEHR